MIRVVFSYQSRILNIGLDHYNLDIRSCFHMIYFANLLCLLRASMDDCLEVVAHSHCYFVNVISSTLGHFTLINLISYYYKSFVNAGTLREAIIVRIQIDSS